MNRFGLVCVLCVVSLFAMSGCGHSDAEINELKAKLAAKDSAAPPKHGASASASVDPGADSIAKAFAQADGEDSVLIETKVAKGKGYERAAVITASKHGDAEVITSLKGLKGAEWSAEMTSSLKELKEKEAALEKTIAEKDAEATKLREEVATAKKAVIDAEAKVATTEKEKIEKDKEIAKAKSDAFDAGAKFDAVKTALDTMSKTLADVRKHEDDPSTLTVTLKSAGCYTMAGSGSVTKDPATK
jgi:hypothetical protein